MITRPKVSVIVLTYNQEATISTTLDSILMQKAGFDYEIVIADDASADSTRVICEDYAMRYGTKIRLLPEAPNRGIVDNYFAALEACRGEYIGDCAGDDRWCDPLKLQRQAEMLDRHPEASIVFSAWEKVCGDNLISTEDYGITATHVFSGHDLMDLYLSHRLLIVLSTALYRTDIIRDALIAAPALIHNREFACEDLPVICALLERGRGIYDPHVTLSYTVGDDSITNPRSLRRACDFYRDTLRATCILAEKYHIGSPALRHYCHQQADYIVSLAFRLRSRMDMKKALTVCNEYGLRLSWKSRAKIILSGLFRN